MGFVKLDFFARNLRGGAVERKKMGEVVGEAGDRGREGVKLIGLRRFIMEMHIPG